MTTEREKQTIEQAIKNPHVKDQIDQLMLNLRGSRQHVIRATIERIARYSSWATMQIMMPDANTPPPEYPATTTAEPTTERIAERAKHNIEQDLLAASIVFERVKKLPPDGRLAFVDSFMEWFTTSGDRSAIVDKMVDILKRDDGAAKAGATGP